MHFVPFTVFAVASGTFGTAEGTQRSPREGKRVKWNEMHPITAAGSLASLPSRS